MSVRPTLLSIAGAMLLAAAVGLAGMHDACRADQASGEAAAASESKEKKNAKQQTPDEAKSAADNKAASDKDAASQSYGWSAVRDGAKIKLRGSVPSEEDRRTVLGMAKAHFADLEIEDQQKVKAGGPPKEQWLGAVSFALKQLTHLSDGGVRLTDSGFQVDGAAKSAEDYKQLRQALTGPFPTGLSIQGSKVKAPVADPFVFSAALEANILTFAGNVPSEEMHKRILDFAEAAFGGATLNDKLMVASGAPKRWDDAALAAIAALSRLNEGKVTLSGSELTIDGMAPDRSTATELSFQLRKDLPSVFHSSETIRWKEAGTQGDVANTILPRIKEIADTEGLALDRVLPSFGGNGGR
ncbi:hypothetical protein V6C03_11135 [Methyloligella sp. 2.7D]|uniref:hypothetical protein n=1 Tax=unclassified Methyloligella TaxID=2625955 RepID=UPI00157C0A16|nr:hypothetical protein [Methyloligella sp. GL2]QKP77627.1 hypothetical protein HT051_09325 [Methyloligella sp. GL2]